MSANGSFWRRIGLGRAGLWKICGKAIFVLGLLFAFAQWYLPKRGWLLAVPADSPDFMNLQQMLV